MSKIGKYACMLFKWHFWPSIGQILGPVFGLKMTLNCHPVIQSTLPCPSVLPDFAWWSSRQQEFVVGPATAAATSTASPSTPGIRPSPNPSRSEQRPRPTLHWRADSDCPTTSRAPFHEGPGPGGCHQCRFLSRQTEDTSGQCNCWWCPYCCFADFGEIYSRMILLLSHSSSLHDTSCILLRQIYSRRFLGNHSLFLKISSRVRIISTHFIMKAFYTACQVFVQ